MDQEAVTPLSRVDWRKGRTDAIRRFVSEYASCEHEDLLSQMLVTICRLAADKPDRGDVKILNAALRELRYALKIFAPYTEVPKVSMFGSSRTPEDHPQYREAKKFAELIQFHGWMVITGAGDGIMRAGHHGASREASFGVAISLPFEQATNTIIADDPKLINFKYFFTRKLMFVKEAKAIVLFPGGFGTQDEGFESLTLVQTLKSTPIPIVMCEEPGGTYWQGWRDFVVRDLLNNRMIDVTDLDLFTLTDRAEDAVSAVLQFYRRYHSSRFVGDRLVFRLERRLSPDSLSQINEAFADILLDGTYEQQDQPLPEEEGAYPAKPRLIFRFNHRSAGRLRALINSLNDAP